MVINDEHGPFLFPSEDRVSTTLALSNRVCDSGGARWQACLGIHTFPIAPTITSSTRIEIRVS